MMRKYRRIIDICILLQKENYIWSNKLWDFCLPTVQKYLYFKDEYQCQYYFIIKDDYAACQEKKDWCLHLRVDYQLCFYSVMKININIMKYTSKFIKDSIKDRERRRLASPEGVKRDHPHCLIHLGSYFPSFWEPDSWVQYVYIFGLQIITGLVTTKVETAVGAISDTDVTITSIEPCELH